MEYQETALDVTAMTAEQLLESDKEEMARRMRLVIETEGPVIDDLLEKRVLHSYGLAKRGRRIAPMLREVRLGLGAVSTSQKSADGKEHLVYWPESWRDKDIEKAYTLYRAPSPRDITEYPIIEIANLMTEIGLKKKKKDLWKETLHRLGFVKQGSNIRSSFKLAQGWAKKHRL